MTEPTKTSAGRWDDLGTRVLSALVMLVAGAVEVWTGGPVFTVTVVILTGIMIWELAGLTAPWADMPPARLGSFACLSLGFALLMKPIIAVVMLAGPSAVLLATERRDRVLASAYAALIMLAGYGLVKLREEAGIAVILWVVAIVIASDVLGYFAGRMLGGPKFWARISPKKTWSGTIAGWIGAALVGAVFVWKLGADPRLVPISVLVAFAGQMGDILESWIKRRAGVKDASNLIPGHGGVLDRFDALIGAVVTVSLVNLFLPISPLVGG